MPGFSVEETRPGGTTRVPVLTDCNSCRLSVRFMREFPTWKYFLSARTTQHPSPRLLFNSLFVKFREDTECQKRLLSLLACAISPTSNRWGWNASLFAVASSASTFHDPFITPGSASSYGFCASRTAVPYIADRLGWARFAIPTFDPDYAIGLVNPSYSRSRRATRTCEHRAVL